MLVRAFAAIVLSWCLVILADHARAASLTFTPSQDTTIYQDAPGNTNGAGSVFIAGRAGGSGNPPPLRRALLEFDLSTVPGGTLVQSASLTLTLTQSAGTNPVAFGLYNVSGAWGEAGSVATAPGQGTTSAIGDATWTTRVTGATTAAPWVTAGGDYTATASATSFVSGLTASAPTPYTWLATPHLVADVQHWLDDPAANFGWILIGGEGSPGTARQFASSENAIESYRPLLTLVTVPVPEPSTWLALILGLVVLEIARRQRRMMRL